MKLLYEGKAKKIWEDGFYIRQEFKDSITALNGKLKEEIEGKGDINNAISCILFEILRDAGLDTHYQKKISEREMLCEKVEIIPLEVIVRNFTAGSICKRYDLPEGQPINLVEFFYKNDSLNDPLISIDCAIELKILTEKDVKSIILAATAANLKLKQVFDQVNLRLIDIKFEFGRIHNRLVLADEISPDTCRLQDLTTKESLDKDRFRKNLGNVKQSYQEVLTRLKNVFVGSE